MSPVATIADMSDPATVRSSSQSMPVAMWSMSSTVMAARGSAASACHSATGAGSSRRRPPSRTSTPTIAEVTLLAIE